MIRSGALPGDEVWVTGALGGAAAAVRAWEEGAVPGAALRRCFARPEPRTAEARCLAEWEVLHALIDLSDGLAGDAGHLAAASSVRVILESDVPVVPEALEAHGPEGGVALALHGGEDYELCLTAPRGGWTRTSSPAASAFP